MTQALFTEGWEGGSAPQGLSGTQAGRGSTSYGSIPRDRKSPEEVSSEGERSLENCTELSAASIQKRHTSLALTLHWPELLRWLHFAVRGLGNGSKKEVLSSVALHTDVI